MEKLTRPKNEILEGGAVTLTFDDGWLCTYQNAFPILQRAGLKGTYYIISGCLGDEQFPQYMNEAHIKNLVKAGHEIGCHTASHKHLLQETRSIAENEIVLSKKYLEKIIGPVKTFCYPFGDYNEEIIGIVKNAGFIGATSVIDGFNNSKTNPFLLLRKTVKVDTQPGEVKTWINYARDNNLWLILMFHQIDYEGRIWSTTPEKLEEIADYLKDQKMKVITIREGLEI